MICTLYNGLLTPFATMTLVGCKS